MIQLLFKHSVHLSTEQMIAGSTTEIGSIIISFSTGATKIMIISILCIIAITLRLRYFYICRRPKRRQTTMTTGPPTNNTTPITSTLPLPKTNKRKKLPSKDKSIVRKEGEDSSSAQGPCKPRRTKSARAKSALHEAAVKKNELTFAPIFSPPVLQNQERCTSLINQDRCTTAGTLVAEIRSSNMEIIEIDDEDEENHIQQKPLCAKKNQTSRKKRGKKNEITDTTSTNATTHTSTINECEKQNNFFRRHKTTTTASYLCALCVTCNCNLRERKKTAAALAASDNTPPMFSKTNAEMERALIARLARLEKNIAWFQQSHSKVLLDLKRIRSKLNAAIKKDNSLLVFVPNAMELEHIYDQQSSNINNNNNNNNSTQPLGSVTKNAQKALFPKTTKTKSYQPSLTQMFPFETNKASKKISNSNSDVTLLNEENFHASTSSNCLEIIDAAATTKMEEHSNVDKLEDDNLSKSSSCISIATLLQDTDVHVDDKSVKTRADDSSDASKFSISGSSLFWAAATTHNDPNKPLYICNSLGIADASIDFEMNARTIETNENEESCSNGIETLLDLLNNDNHMEVAKEQQNNILFHKIVTKVEHTFEEEKIRDIEELCPQWKENVDYVTSEVTDITAVVEALSNVQKEIDANVNIKRNATKQLNVLEFFELTLQEAYYHLQQRSTNSSCIVETTEI